MCSLSYYYFSQRKRQEKFRATAAIIITYSNHAGIDN
jgi:hypothetical protein